MAALLRECTDAAAQKDKDMASLTHLLSIYSGADSPSGKDPRGYEAAKRFLAMARADEEAGRDGTADAAAEGGRNGGTAAGEDGGRDGGPSGAVPAKPCGGRPGHPGRSHHAKSDRTVPYTAKMCDTCGNTDLELMAPIKKPAADFGECVEGEEDAKDRYTNVATFGWCGTCRAVIDPAPHLVWGTWVEGRAMAAIIQYKSNPQGRSSIVDNLGAVHRFVISPGAVSNAITAYARNLEGRVLPDSVAAFVKAKMEAAEPEAAEPEAAEPEAAEPEAATPLPSPAHPTIPAGPPRRKTRKELKAEENRIPYGQTPQGTTDTRLTQTTTSYPGSHRMSFMEWCREWLTMAPYLGIDETKTIAAGKWCHSIVVASPNVTMITVRPRKNTKAVNWLFGGMGHVCVVHDRIAIYNGFAGPHQECWAHLIRRFLKLAIKHGIGSPEYDRYLVIKALYKRAKDLAARLAAALGTPSNAAEMAACRHRLERAWHAFEPEYHSITNGLLGLVRDLILGEDAPPRPDVCGAARHAGHQQYHRIRWNGHTAPARLRSPAQLAGRPELWHDTDVRGHLPQERHVAVPRRAGPRTGPGLERIPVRRAPAHTPAHDMKVGVGACDRACSPGRLDSARPRTETVRAPAARPFGMLGMEWSGIWPQERHRPYQMVPKPGRDCHHAADTEQVRYLNTSVPIK